MAMLVVTIGVELVALGILFLTVCKRQTKCLKWILGVIAGFTQIAFWYLAIKYWTVYFMSEVALEIVVVLLCIAIVLIGQQKEKKIREKKMKNWILTILMAFLVTIGIFGINVIEYQANIRWAEPTSKIEEEKFGVPENLREFDVKFECIRNLKEKRYDLYQVWRNGICKIASYSEDECKVYRLPDISSNRLPRVETEEKTKYRYNYNFEKYQKPTVEETSTEETYKLYVSESSYKEDYTDD